jgi:hypothetical protein
MKALKRLRHLGRQYRATHQNEGALDAALRQLQDTAFASECGRIVTSSLVEDEAHVPYLGNVYRNDFQGYRWVGLRAWACGDYPFGPGGIINSCYSGCSLCEPPT